MESKNKTIDLRDALLDRLFWALEKQCRSATDTARIAAEIRATIDSLDNRTGAFPPKQTVQTTLNCQSVDDMSFDQLISIALNDNETDAD